MRSLLLLFFLILSSLANAAQEWDEFHQNLEHFEFEKAIILARALPPGGPRELALAEVAIEMGRIDHTFVQTDRLPKMGALPSHLQAKYCWVKLHQESKSEYPTIKRRKKAVSRWVREGLRRPGMLHDQIKLMRYKIRNPDGESSQELLDDFAAMQGVTSSQVLQAQAYLLKSTGHAEPAASLWRAVSEKARLEGHTRAAIFHSVRALRCIPEKEEMIVKVGRQLLDEAIVLRDGFALKNVWGLSWSLPIQERQDWYRATTEALPNIPNSEARLQLIEALSHSRYPEKLENSKLGLQLARERGDSYYQALFLRKLTQFHLKPSQKREAQSQLDAILAALDTRGILYKFKRSGNEESASMQIESLSNSLRSALKSGDCLEAERVFFSGLERAFEWEGAERSNALYHLFLEASISSRKVGVRAYRGDLSVPIRKALGEKLARRDALLARILNNRYKMITLSGLDSYTGPTLASWLAFVSRKTEAREVLSQTIQGLTAEHQRYSEARVLGELMLESGDISGLEMISQNLSNANAYALSIAAWQALKHDHPRFALDWSERALESAPKEQVSAFQLFQLRALALANEGDIEAALEVLEQRATELEQGESLPYYHVIKADLLLRGGRAKEAVDTLDAAPVSGLSETPFYELDVRRRIAQAVGRPDPLLSAADDYLKTLSKNPIFSFYVGEALGRSQGSVLPPHQSKVTFAQLSRILEELREREPKNDTLKEISITDLKRLSRNCNADELMVQPVLLQSSVAFLTLKQDQLSFTEVFCDRHKLDKTSHTFTRLLSSPNSKLEGYDWTYLYSQLVEPWLRERHETTKLRWIARGKLARLPLAALPDGQGGYLRESLSSMVLDGPSVGSFSLNRDEEILLIGGAPDLKGATKEFAEMKALFPKSTTWSLGSDLLELKKKSSKAKIVHISTHASAPSQKRSSGQLSGNGNTLTAFQLSELIIPEASLAFVAACESLRDAETGRDNTSLTGALRAAGADMVVGVLWRVDDQVTSALVTSFYRHLKQGQKVEQALAAAQAEIAERWPHPYFWAGLQIVTGP